MHDATESVPVAPRQDTTWRLWLEIIAVLCIGVVPDTFNALMGFINPSSEPASVVETMLFLVVRGTYVSIPVLYLMWRSNEGWAPFGVVPVRWFDPAIALPLLMIDMLFYYSGWCVFAMVLPMESEGAAEHSEGLFEYAMTPIHYVLLIIGSVFNGFAEELVMRGYLIPRLGRVLGSWWSAMVLSSVLFAGYHLYQGVWGAGTVLVTGLIFGSCFILTRRLWPVVIAHILADIVAFIDWYSIFGAA